jgi:hypothetical protein
VTVADNTADKDRIVELEAKAQQAYHVIAQLLGGPDGKNPDIDSAGGLRALDYFAHEEYDDDFLPYVHPRAIPR